MFSVDEEFDVQSKDTFNESNVFSSSLDYTSCELTNTALLSSNYLETLSPPNNIDNFDNDSSLFNQLWDNSPISKNKKLTGINIWRDCFITDIKNTLECNASKSLQVLIGKKSFISNSDIRNIVDDIINNEPSCCYIKENYLTTIQNDMVRKLSYSLSNTTSSVVELSE